MTASQSRRIRDTSRKLKSLDVEQANCAAIPRTLDIRKRSDTRPDEGKGDNQCEQGRGQTERDGYGAGDDDDKNRVQTTNDEPDDVNDSQALTGGDIRNTGNVQRASASCHKIGQISSSCQCSCCPMANPPVADLKRVQRIRRYLMGRPRAECLFHGQQRVELEVYSDADW